MLTAVVVEETATGDGALRVFVRDRGYIVVVDLDGKTAAEYCCDPYSKVIAGEDLVVVVSDGSVEVLRADGTRARVGDVSTDAAVVALSNRHVAFHEPSYEVTLGHRVTVFDLASEQRVLMRDVERVFATELDGDTLVLTYEEWTEETDLLTGSSEATDRTANQADLNSDTRWVAALFSNNRNQLEWTSEANYNARLGIRPDHLILIIPDFVQ